MTPRADFEARIAGLDTGLWRYVPSQTTPNDRHSLLAIQWAMRSLLGEFAYLEIGSHLGGSLQSMVADPKCVHVVSMDSRPLEQPDERGIAYPYAGNSTVRMLSMLAGVPGADLGKVHAIEAGTERFSPRDLPRRPDLCFVDGEHTDESVLRDSRFCLEAMPEDGCVVFHDANVVYRGLRDSLVELAARGRPFRAYNLPDSLLVVELGRLRLGEAPCIRSLLDNNHIGYLHSLLGIDHYRQICRYLLQLAGEGGPHGEVRLDEPVRELVHRVLDGLGVKTR